MRVVADTNTLISAFLWQGTPEKFFVLAQKKRITLCATNETLSEFKEVLSYPKFKNRLASIGKTPEAIIDEFLAIVRYYPSKRLPTPQILQDPSDDAFLACALSAKASFIISGDRHLLDIKKFQGIPIVTPAQFLKQDKF